MHKATKFMAALVLTLGLAACGGGSGAASSAADATSTASTANTASTASAASVSSTTETTSAGKSTTTSTADYINEELGISYTAPEGFFAYESASGDAAFVVANTSGESVNLVISELSGNESIDDPDVMDAIVEEFTNSLASQGIEGADVKSGTHSLPAGTFPAVVGTGTIDDATLTLEQVYVQLGKKVCIFTAVSAGSTSADTMLAGIELL